MIAARFMLSPQPQTLLISNLPAKPATVAFYRSLTEPQQVSLKADG
jgi:hypothetical protein